MLNQCLATLSPFKLHMQLFSFVFPKMTNAVPRVNLEVAPSRAVSWLGVEASTQTFIGKQ